MKRHAETAVEAGLKSAFNHRGIKEHSSQELCGISTCSSEALGPEMYSCSEKKEWSQRLADETARVARGRKVMQRKMRGLRMGHSCGS